MANETGSTPQASQQNTALVATSNSPSLLQRMASQYGMDPNKFKDVLLKTIFPQDKVATMEQLAMFVSVAHKYQLNPLTKEIYAFPTKGGGIVPIVGIDGWISLVQRQDDYNGHKFIYEWVDGKVGGKLAAATCQIFRKDLANPIEHTEFMEECARGTEPWNKWPRRMLTHKSFSQCARYAFGLGGVYDQDEAERIIEAELKPAEGGGFTSEIKMPQRQQPVTAAHQALVTGGTITMTVPAENSTRAVSNEATIQGTALVTGNTVLINGDEQSFYTEDEPESDGPKDYGFGEATKPESESEPPAADVPTADELFAKAKEEEKPTTPVANKDVIGPGRAKRIRAIIHAKKTRTDADLKELMQTFKVEHLENFPMNRHKEIEDWAEGR